MGAKLVYYNIGNFKVDNNHKIAYNMIYYFYIGGQEMSTEQIVETVEESNKVVDSLLEEEIVKERSGSTEHERPASDRVVKTEEGNVLTFASENRQAYDQRAMAHFNVVRDRVIKKHHIETQDHLIFDRRVPHTDLVSCDQLLTSILKKDKTDETINSLRGAFKLLDPTNKHDASVMVDLVERACINVAPAIRRQLIWLIVKIEYQQEPTAIEDDNISNPVGPSTALAAGEHAYGAKYKRRPDGKLIRTDKDEE